MSKTRVYWMILCVGMFVGALRMNAAAMKSKSPQPSADRIDVIAHIPLSGTPVTQLAVATHWQKDYLYVDHGATGPVAVMDVTNPSAPAAAGELYVPQQQAGARLSAVVGAAALVTSGPALPTRNVRLSCVSSPELPPC